MFPVVALGLAAAILGGCGGSRPAESSLPGGGDALAPLGDIYQGIGAVLPPPSALEPLLSGDKQVSYNEEDYIRHGNQYDSGLPLRNATAISNYMQFDTDWSAATGMDPADLGFCGYSFDNLSSYARDPEVRYGWSHPPEEIGTAWLALADWDRNRWVWHQCTEAGVFAVPSFAPFIDSADHLVAMMVMANAEKTALRWIRLGPLMVTAELSVSPNRGIAPLDITLDASGSSCGLGTTISYTFDLDGDGEFDVGGSTSSYDVNVPAAGEYNYTAMVRNDYGVEATANAQCTASDPWTHSWGGSGIDSINAVATDGEESIYVVGSTKSYGAGDEDVLVLKYNLNGTLAWARCWGGPNPDFGLAADYADQSLYVGGSTRSYGVGTIDALIQCWDADGNVTWSLTTGLDSEDSIAKINGLSISGDKLYLAGSQSWTASDLSALVMQCSQSGAILWGKVWLNSTDDIAHAIKARFSFGAQATRLYITGQSNTDLLYLFFDDEGGLLSSRVWAGGSLQRGTCISVYGLFSEIFIGGSIGAGSDADVLLLATSDGLAKRWGGSSNEAATGLLRNNDDLYICGNSISFHPTRAGLFLKCTTDDELEDLQLWKSDSIDENLTSICRYPGSGILLGGTCASADGGGWSPASDVLSDQPGTWSDVTGQVHDYSCETTAPSVSAVAITDALIDMGGGDSDALLATRSF